MKKGSIVAVCAVLAVGAVTGLAFAKVAKVKSNVSIAAPALHTFTGTVQSKRKPCRTNRKVEIKRVESGDDPTVGFDLTDANAAYSVTSTGSPSGTFYARARKKLKIVSGNGVVCRPANSAQIPVNFP